MRTVAWQRSHCWVAGIWRWAAAGSAPYALVQPGFTKRMVFRKRPAWLLPSYWDIQRSGLTVLVVTQPRFIG